MHSSTTHRLPPTSDPGCPLERLLADAVDRYPARTAIRDPDGTFTYSELGDRAKRVAAGFARLGLSRGDRVMCLLPDNRAAVVFLYATAYAGLTFIPVDRHASVYRLRWLISDSKPNLVVTTAEGFADALAAGAKAVATPADAAFADPVAAPAVAKDDDEHPVFLMYTSGSTSHPRAVVCHGKQVDFAARAIASRLAYSPQDVVFSRSPLSFDYGLYQVILCALAGATLVLPGDDHDVALLASIRQNEATVLPLVPGLATVLAQLAARRPTTTRVRMVTNTGAALTAPVAARLRQSFPDAAIRFMYGMTECKRITISDPDDDLAYPGSVGFPLPGTEVEVIGDDGENVPAGTVGQIVASGPHVMNGYWNDPIATAERFRLAPDAQRSVLTGDYGWLDETGRLYFSGRRDDLLKRRGVRTSVQEIEAAMLDIPGVTAVAVMPMRDGRLVAWATTDTDGKAVLAGVAERLGAARTPDECLLLAELPLTSNGKTDRAALRAMWEAS